MKGQEIELGGKTRYLRYDLNAIHTLGEKLNVTVRLAHIQEDLMERPLPLGALRTLVWAGLLHADPELKEEEVGTWIDTENFAEVLGGFFGAFGMTSSDGEEVTLSRMLGTEDGIEGADVVELETKTG